jgi:cystathionine beta-lyase/cystathionine gamma-synthase
MQFETHAIHTGQKPEEQFGAVIPPVYLTSTFAQESPGNYKLYDYTRAGNPNFTNAEETIAALEEGRYATVFSSGLAAITAIASTLKSGDKVVAGNDLYGGTFRLFTQVFNRFQINFELVDFENEAQLEKALSKDTKLLLIETPTNPLLKIIDIQKITQLAKSKNIQTLVDNTFASPYFQKPLLLGADMSLHSGTKYLGGHSDLISGVLITNNPHIKEAMDFARKAIGLNPSPFDTWLLSRSLKTLALRMQAHEKNAFKIAQFLESHPKVAKVYYPGLKSHHNHEIAAKQMSGFSGMISVEFNLQMPETLKLISSFQVFTLAESLGGVESLVDHPATMTHASIPAAERAKMGLSDGLIRFSVGLEHADDLIADLEKGLEKI